MIDDVAVSQSLKVIAGRYRLESLLGEGGMASVWRAKDMTLQRPVAVKLLFARDERDAELLVARFLREARIAAAVQHRNVIHIVDFGTTETGQPYMVMELLEGESLGDRLHRERLLPLDEAIRIASMTLRGLAAVHDANIIHRDLKPDNIYLKEEGGVVYPKILDFGISRSLEPTSGRRSALTTREGVIVGTPEYMSPEQARGLKELDRRTDLYSMGVILYQMLVGKLPMQSENVGDLIIKIVTQPAPSAHEENPDVPLALSQVLARAMAKQPADRFADALEMQQALHAAAEDALGAVRRSLSDLPPSSLAIPDGIPVSRDRTMLSREFPLGTTDAQTPPGRVPGTLGDPTAERFPQATQPQISVGTGELAVQLTGKKRSAWLWPAVIAGACGVLAFAVFRPEEENIKTSHVVAPGPAAAPATVALGLRNLPAAATVTIDGAPMAGDHVSLPKDGKARTIVVNAPGKKPWQAVYTATFDGTYDVVLEDAANPSEPGAAAPSPSETNPSAATRPNNAPRKQKRAVAAEAPPGTAAAHGKSASALRDLDF